MKTPLLLALAAGLTLLPARPAPAPEDDALAAAVRAFSATTRVDGAGWEAYAEFLHPEFTRWTMQPDQRVLDKDEITENLKPWWEAGSRVGDSESETISVTTRGNLGIVRRNVRELYVDGEGADAGSSRNHVTQVWIREKEAWRLLSMDIAPMPEPDAERRK